MNITVREHGDHVVAKLDGVLDEGARTAFDESLHSIVASPGKRLVVDLSGSPRITSAGIGHLVTLVSRANTKGSAVVLANPTPFVSSIFGTTKLTKFLDIEDTVDAAVARLRNAE